jgi:hypothetical protein
LATPESRLDRAENHPLIATIPEREHAACDLSERTQSEVTHVSQRDADESSKHVSEAHEFVKADDRR